MSTSYRWQRTDGFGSELAVVDTSEGMRATGWALGGDRDPYSAAYTLRTDAAWRTTLLEVRTEGAGWYRTLRMERDEDGWRVRAGETGTLDAVQPGAEFPETFDGALDVDLGRSPLTNTLPIRRLGLLDAAPGTRHEVTVAWVELPSLAVVADVQEYAATGAGSVRFRSDDFRVEIGVDDTGFVTRYPGLAARP